MHALGLDDQILRFCSGAFATRCDRSCSLTTLGCLRNSSRSRGTTGLGFDWSARSTRLGFAAGARARRASRRWLRDLRCSSVAGFGWSASTLGRSGGLGRQHCRGGMCTASTTTAAGGGRHRLVCFVDHLLLAATWFRLGNCFRACDTVGIQVENEANQ